MTSPSPSVDPVRERLQQISNEWANHDDGGTPALIAAIEAVLELHRPENPIYVYPCLTWAAPFNEYPAILSEVGGS